MKKFAAIVLAAMALMVSSANATVLWNGGFSGGDLSHWGDKQTAVEPKCSLPYDPNRLTVVTDQPAGSGNAGALRITLNAGDEAFNCRHTPAISMNHRSELTKDGQLKEGDERWYSFTWFIPTTYAVTDGKGGGSVIAQFHHVNSSGDEPGSPPILFSALTDKLLVVQVPSLNSQNDTNLLSTPLPKGRWFTVVTHIKFSSSDSKGLIEVWIDGSKLLSKTTHTMFSGYTNYLKVGLYGRPTTIQSNQIFVAGVVEATTQADVMPTSTPPTPAPDAGTPAPKPDAGAPQCLCPCTP